MSTDDNFNATAIVPTNLLRQTMNIRKAETNCSRNKTSLTNCAAIDICSTLELSECQHRELLHLDMSSSKIKDALPGFLPLYIGMPIVLKCKNISTDLGITNGSQGFVRHFDIKKTSSGFTCCTCVLVDFPDSKVKIPDLPQHFFPIVPVKTSFTTQLTSENGPKIKVKITRTQIPIQPAFAITGHSAQGKTLPNILTNLEEGGFGAYVTTSRARNRYGLHITEPVTLHNLNKPIPYSLVQEGKCLQAIEHNTYICYGFKHTDYKSIPDPESEQNANTMTFVAQFETTDIQHKGHEPQQDDTNACGIAPNRHKRKANIRNPTVQNDQNPKRSRSYTHTQSPTKEIQPISSGCIWSNIDWSCAYDSMLMSLFYTYLSFNIATRKKWCQEMTLTDNLAMLFDNLLRSNESLMSSNAFNVVRDKLHNFLSEADPILFTRYGTVGAPAEAIFSYVKDPHLLRICVHSFCSSANPCLSPTTTSTIDYMPSIFSCLLWTICCKKSMTTIILNLQILRIGSTYSLKQNNLFILAHHTMKVVIAHV